MAGLQASDPLELERQLEEQRRPLTGYCYRMLGSSFEAEDAVQEAFLRAWRNADRFEGRSAFKSWLYKIATNVCLDMLDGRKRRARPMDLSEVGTPESHLTSSPEATWLEPIPDGRVLAATADPAELAQERETLRLAFVNALQHLPAKQRSVLILREVLRWSAAETAELLDTSVASVNSALQRARASLDAGGTPLAQSPDELGDDQRLLLDRYVKAFEAYDMDGLTSLLAEDATMSMPPYDLWLRGHEHIRTWFLTAGAACRGSRVVPTSANGSPAYAQYRRNADGPGYHAWGLGVLDTSGGRIVGINTFLDVERLFPLFGLPLVPAEPEDLAQAAELG
jgi:RNA polymerase sigma-70 factor (ECF subfamily)